MYGTGRRKKKGTPRGASGRVMAFLLSLVLLCGQLCADQVSAFAMEQGSISENSMESDTETSSSETETPVGEETDEPDANEGEIPSQSTEATEVTETDETDTLETETPSQNMETQETIETDDGILPSETETAQAVETETETGTVSPAFDFSTDESGVKINIHAAEGGDAGRNDSKSQSSD